MELSPQETALILPSESRENAVAAALAGGLADFLQSYGRALQTAASALLART
jgi:hypothetical protein